MIALLILGLTVLVEASLFALLVKYGGDIKPKRRGYRDGYNNIKVKVL